MSERARELKVEGAFAITAVAFPDERGIFVSPYEQTAFVDAVGHPLFPVAQASYSVSRRGVVRGVHFTATPPGCAKYVYCPRGRVLDVAVDLRVGSPTFGAWDSLQLGGGDFTSVYLPVGLGHLFVALEDDTVMTYLLSQEYHRENELAVSCLDPRLGLPIPESPVPGEIDALLSERDRDAPTVAEALDAGLLPEYVSCLRAEAELG